mmetsp:Transcript_12930/g.19450  ORF Transcript_12930/g.19450 Transcript_12930/m.19450 type:complete len:271 (+) Transcript_12930:149-961(+)|eukprot:CAMPEP_0185033004 /NCGR_PEP_ID=MMETSP1103-20130426/21601_1 /TAXON_ID=36769 /ORGANISM="Paraphysomonas bandaiensis, Strain Caron Lab Isolate" /LENGTH=270 /DNA_ID=CAMNT_0027569125 /DNA_START=59 /DNA_END=871 /DNA_ORIENTATION=+
MARSESTVLFPIPGTTFDDRKIKLYLADVVSACTSAFLVAPFIKIVDQTVTQKAAFNRVNIFHTAFSNFKTFILSPVKFMSHPTFLAVCIVYGGTYSAANTILTYCELNQQDSFYPKLAGTTAVNMALGITKDRYFAQVYSKKKAPKLPLASWGLFFARDILTIGAAFNFPSMAADYLVQSKAVTEPHLAESICQITVPVFAQMCLTPVHLLALDFYNRTKVTWLSRATQLKNIYFESTAMRMIRVMGAYGIAGVSNSHIRKSLRERVLK